ncbi:MAG TPA: 3-hydroxyacyl-CoA dehydrogenase NAD-binding domain-containing protein [Chloroflexia bacterium]|nr:3-hydroxyacyl-CoA dehydrogenase NAD-binding domain-containing protein [Chloroflexia bacterium]
MTKTPEYNARRIEIEMVEKLCVVGAGTTGAQIAMLAALSGYKVSLTDSSQTALDRAIESSRSHLLSRVNSGKLSQEQADHTLDRLNTTTSLLEAADNADFVIESICEDLELKKELFRQLDKICPPHTIIASNSPHHLVSKIATDIVRKDKTCNMHFFHPALVMQLVEIVRGIDTSDETVEVARELAYRLGKEVVVMQKEIFSFIGNSGLLPDMETPVYPVVKTLKAESNRLLASLDNANLAGATHQHSNIRNKYHDTDDPHDNPPTFLEELVKGKFTGNSGSHCRNGA